MGLQVKRKLKDSTDLPKVYVRIGKVEYHSDTVVVYMYYYKNKESRDGNYSPELIRDYEFESKKDDRKSLYKELKKIEEFEKAIDV